MLPTAILGRQTQVVTSFATSPRNPIEGRLAGLAGELARLHGGSVGFREEESAPERVTGRGFLAVLAERFRLDALAWVPRGREPVVGGRGYGLRTLVQSLDWPLMAGLRAGDCLDLRSEAHPGSGRLRSLAGHGFMAKPAHNEDGTLVGLSSLPVQGSRTR